MKERQQRSGSPMWEYADVGRRAPLIPPLPPRPTKTEIAAKRIITVLEEEKIPIGGVPAIFEEVLEHINYQAVKED